MSYAGRVAVLTVCILAARWTSPSWSWGQDWPQWRGPNRDARASGFQAPDVWPEELTNKWSVEVGDGVATPALVDGKLYVFTRQEGNEILRCLDADTGQEFWQDSYQTAGATGPASSYAGPRASPTVAEGKVVTYGVRGVLSCYDADSGDLLWRNEAEGEAWPVFFTSSSPIIVEGLCIAQLGGRRDGAVVAFDLSTGDEKWRWTGDGTAYASPVLMTIDGAPVVVAETDASIVALDVADGGLLWQIPYTVSGRGYNAATPVVADQTIIYTGTSRGAKAVRLTKSGNELTAEELWSNEDNSVQYNTPVVKDGLLFGLTNLDSFFCINTESGETAWTAPFGTSASAERPAAPGGGRRGGRGRGRGGYGSIVDAGPVLFALNPSAQLIVFEPNDAELKQLASYKVAESSTYAYPVVSGNRIFVKDQDSVTLWTIP